MIWFIDSLDVNYELAFNREHYVIKQFQRLLTQSQSTSLKKHPTFLSHMIILFEEKNGKLRELISSRFTLNTSTLICLFYK